MKIYKYPLELKERQIIELNSYQILSVGEQNGKLVAYAPHMEYLSHDLAEVIILGTGQDAPDDIDKFQFIQTVFSKNGFVWHVFYRPFYEEG